MVFNPNSPEYRTCCCHVKTCTIIIGILEALYLIGQVIDGGANFSRDNDTEGTTILISSIIGLAIGTIVLILLFVGVCKHNHYFLIPHLILQIFGLIFLSVVAIILLLGLMGLIAIAITEDDKWENKQTVSSDDNVEVIARIVGFLIAAFFEVWFFIVVLKCYRFFRDQRREGYVGGAPMAIAYHA